MTALLDDRLVAGRSSLSVVRADERVHVRIGGSGRADVPSVRPMLLDSGQRHARVALVPDGALLLAGDAVRLDIEVGPDVHLELVEPSGTVAFDMRGGKASWDVHVTVGAGSTVLWAGEPFVVAAGARVRRTTTVTLDAGARLALRETIVLGRHGEARGGHLTQVWTAHDRDGVPVLVEDVVLDEASHRPGILGRHRVLGSVVALGIDVAAEAEPEGRLDLEAGGSVWRRLADEAHRAVPVEAWRAVVRQCERPGPQNS